MHSESLIDISRDIKDGIISIKLHIAVFKQSLPTTFFEASVLSRNMETHEQSIEQNVSGFERNLNTGPKRICSLAIYFCL